jgi:hypothetical protein
MRVRLFFSTLLYSLLSCSSSVSHSEYKPIFTLKSFRKTVELNGAVAILPGVKRPVRLTLIPDKNILMCLESEYGSKKNWLCIYSLDSLKLIRSIIKNGEDDGQLLGGFQLQYNSRSGGEVYITDIVKQQINVYKVDSLIAGNGKPSKIIGKPFLGYQSVNINQDRLTRSVIINKSYDIVDTRTSALNNKRMLLNKYRSDFSVRDSFGLYPPTMEATPPDMLGRVLDGCLGISTDDKCLVFTGLTTDYLSVYDTSGKLIASAIGPGELDVSYKIEKAGEGERIIPLSGHFGYACKTRIDRSSIYALYNGKDRKSRDEHASDLLQFDKQLHPETRYKLNTAVFDFDIDWRTKRLYGLRREGSTNQIVIYQL